MPDFLDDKKREIRERLKELRPLVDEAARLESALRALEGVSDGATATATPARRTAAKSTRAKSTRAKSTSAKSTGKSGGRRGRPKGSGPRAIEALKLVTERPGITIPELAVAMDIQQNYLYRVLPGLQKDGKVRKEGRGWHPMDAAPATAAAGADKD